MYNCILPNAQNSVKSPTFLDSIEITKHDNITIYCAKCGYAHSVSLRCGDRTCSECRSRDYFRLLSQYKTFLQSKSRLRLLTLTLRGRPSYLHRSRVIHIRNCFNKLLRQSFYKTRLLGGFYSIEAKKKEYLTGYAGWNVHIHILFEGGYIMQQRLKRDWKVLTGDAYIVDIRSAYSGISGLKYMLKYLLKPPTTLGSDWEYNNALKGIRLISAFGSWYKDVSRIEKQVLKCPVCGCSEWFSPFILDMISRNLSAGLPAFYKRGRLSPFS